MPWAPAGGDLPGCPDGWPELPDWAGRRPDLVERRWGTQSPDESNQSCGQRATTADQVYMPNRAKAPLDATNCYPGAIRTAGSEPRQSIC